MTQREFFTAVINANLSAEMTAFAESRIAHLDSVNSKRTEKGTPKQRANAEVQANIIATIDKGVPFTGKQIAKKYGISPNVATAICGKIVKAGYATVVKERVEKGKGKVNVYTFTAEPVAVDEDVDGQGSDLDTED